MFEFKPIFLFGSGISPAPGVNDLTGKILTADLHRDCNAGPWYRGSPRVCSGGANDPQIVRDFLGLLRQHVAKSRGIELDKISYEDIANLCVQLDYNSDTLRNPAIMPFAQLLRERLALDAEAFAWLPSAALDWMAWSIHYEFTKPELADIAQPKIRAIQSFADFVTQRAASSVVVTLNHDTFLEAAFDYQVQMGFSKPAGAHFSPDLLAQQDAHKPKLIKLHGSIDWFSESGRIVRHQKWPDLHPDWRPILLSGTISKLEDYNYLLFPWLWAEFQNSLRQTRRVVVSGYGFKDLGVNTRLTDWLDHYPDARILILHPKPEDLMREVKGSPVAGVHGFFNRDCAVIRNPAGKERWARISLAAVGFENSMNDPWLALIDDFLQP